MMERDATMAMPMDEANVAFEYLGVSHYFVSNEHL